MVQEYLHTGVNNALTGKYLASLLDCDLRTITAAIEEERRKGAPICATCKGPATGYYLAANNEELCNYIKGLDHRASELNKTSKALRDIVL